MSGSLFNAVIDEIRERFLEIDSRQIEAVLCAMRSCDRVILHGKGRMGMVLKAFGCEMIKAGKDVRVVADVTAPHVQKGDLFIGASASGFPLASTHFFEAARESGAVVCAITAYRKGPVGQLADMFLEIRARTMNLNVIDVPSLQPMCTTMEQVELLVMDYLAALYRQGADVTEANKAAFVDAVLKPLCGFDLSRIDDLIRALETDRKIYFTAEGRQIHILSTFAMRVHHMGFRAYVTHEVNCPAPEAGDVLVASLWDLEDRVTRLRMEMAADMGMHGILLCPVEGGTPLAVQTVFSLGIAEDAQDEGAYTRHLMILLDFAVRRMMELHHWEESDLSCRHTNLE